MSNQTFRPQRIPDQPGEPIEPGSIGRRLARYRIGDWILFALVLVALPPALRALAGQAFRAQAEAAARQVLGDLQLARKLAIAEKAPVRVIFAPGGSAYAVQKQDARGQYQTVGSYALPWAATLGEAAGSVEFSAAGTLPSPASIQVHCWSATRSVKITVQGEMRIR